MTLQRLTESFSIQLNAESKVLNESTNIYGARLIESTGDGETRLIEDSRGNKFKAIASYRVPVSRFTKNANGRVYPRELWEKVIKEQSGIWEGGPGLANHPEDDEDGDVTKQFCVWRNLGINESTQLVEADVCLVGPHGKHANDILEAGGKLGFSSSGYGELKEDKSTVDSKSYMLERVSDWVLNPSQGVYGDISMKKKESVKESTEIETEVNMDESIKNNSIRENTTMDKATEKTKLSKAEIRSFKENVEKYLGEALAIVDPQDRLNELTDIHSYFESMDESVLPEVKTKIASHIEEAKTEIGIAIKEHTKLSQTFGIKEIEALKEGVKRVSEDTMLYKRTSEEWKTVAEGLQERVKKLNAIIESRPTVDAYKTAINFAKGLKEDIEAKDKMLESARASMEVALKKELLAQKNLSEQVKVLEAAKADLIARNKKLREHAANLSDELKAIREVAVAKALSDRDNKLNENTIVIAPRGTANSKLQGFNESNEVRAYYKDLVQRDGVRATALKEKILSCKTVKEAARAYFNYFANDEVNPSVSDSVVETLRMNNGGQKLNETVKRNKNLPDTWV